MHCRPRHTPSTGTPRSPKCRIAAFESPASDGRPGPGEIEHDVGAERVHLVERHRVVAVHDRLRAQLTEVLHEVVDERVVVVDDENSRAHGLKVAGRDSRSNVELCRSRSRKRSRYTPPTPAKAPPSPLWVPVVMATLARVRVDRDRRQLHGAAAGRHVEPLPDARPAAHRVRLPARHDLSLTRVANRRSLTCSGEQQLTRTSPNRKRVSTHRFFHRLWKTIPGSRAPTRPA